MLDLSSFLTGEAEQSRQRGRRHTMLVSKADEPNRQRSRRSRLLPFRPERRLAQFFREQHLKGNKR